MCLFLCLTVLGFIPYKPPGGMWQTFRLVIYDFIAMVYKKRFAYVSIGCFMLGKDGVKLWNEHIENGICAYSFLFWTACMKRYAQNNDALL